MKLTPYQRIVRAARNGVGVHINADEAWQMAQDTAIAQRAEWDDDPESEQMQAEADRRARSSDGLGFGGRRA